MSETRPFHHRVIAALQSRYTRQTLRWLVFSGLAVGILLVLMVLLANSPIGKRFIVDRIAEYAPDNGLHFTVGRIEGDMFSEATLHDVVAYDPEGAFLKVSKVTVDWQPMRWFVTGIDVRRLAFDRGAFLRVPVLRETESEGPLLPEFEIRVRRLEVNDIRIAKALTGGAEHSFNGKGQLISREGKLLVKARANLGGKDFIVANIDAEPDHNKLNVFASYNAPKDGAIAQIFGIDSGYRARITGKGKWTHWDGSLTVERNDAPFAAFQLDKRDDVLGAVGQAYPGDMLTGLPGKTLGNTVSFAARGTFNDRIFRGAAAIRGRGISGEGEGAVDFSENIVQQARVAVRLTDPLAFGDTVWVSGGKAVASISGPFGNLNVRHKLFVPDMIAGPARVSNLTQQGMLNYDGARWTIPVDVTVSRVVTGQPRFDPRLYNGRVRGTIYIKGSTISSSPLAITLPDANGRLSLKGDMASGAYGLTGPVAINNVMVDNVGRVNGGGVIDLSFGANRPWVLQAQVRGQIPKVDNATLANVAGSAIAFRGDISTGANRPFVFRNVGIGAPKLKMSLNGQYANGVTALQGSGEHSEYGPFQVTGTYSEAGPRAQLVFARPYPPLKLSDVTVDIAPIANGFAIDTNGGSRLGDFDGHVELFAPANGPIVIDVQEFRVWKTEIRGKLKLEDGIATGRLGLEGGGVNGDIGLIPRGGGQGFDVELLARNASFGQENPLYVNRARINGTGELVKGKSNVRANVLAKGIGIGSLFIGELAANVELEDGNGEATASLEGQRGALYAMQIQSDIQLNREGQPPQISTLARGTFGGQRISMPRRAVVTQQDDGSWLLSPSQVNYGKGFVIAKGQFGGGYGTGLNLQLSHMPLTLADLFMNGLGLGGDISGEINYAAPISGLPSGDAKVKIAGLTRSGLILTSTPIDVSLVGKLTGDRAETRAVIYRKDNRLGRVQAQITDMPASGSLAERLNAGALLGQLRYRGPAEALWRLAALDAIDITGPLSAAGNIRGTLAAPQLEGTVYSDDLRIRSAISGTDVQSTKVRGRFVGSRLQLSTISGRTSNGGTVRGTGWIDIANVSEGKLPNMDFKFAARQALLLDTGTMKGAVTGPLRVVSSGNGGVLAGRLFINSGSWQLGRADQAEQLPEVRTTEINAPPDLAPPRRPFKPWRYLIDASAPGRLDVDGLGLDSEWSANISLRGTTADPRIGGEAKAIRGYYNFSGNEFDITRGRISFDVNAPINPLVDIVAETKAGDLDVVAKVQGSALQPEITFTSQPPLPEDEIMSRLLFGGSVAELTPTDAVQLAATMASLRGGKGLNPINTLRSAVGLDRLRIVSADPSVGRGPSVAVGKNIGRRAYAEIITDGQGYSATELEYRITNWLSLLATISTVGRNSASLDISRDY